MKQFPLKKRFNKSERKHIDLNQPKHTYLRKGSGTIKKGGIK